MTSLLTRIKTFGLVAAAVGLGAGLIHVVVGTATWTGNKSDPTTLGLLTVGLALVMGVAASRAPHASTTGEALLLAVGLALPALVGMTASGLAWTPAALSGLAAAGLAVAAARRMGPLGRVVTTNWSRVLLGVLAATYVALGITVSGIPGLLGVAGAIVVLLALRHRSRALAAGLLVLGALPFAVVTASSLVTPLTAMLIIVIGIMTTRRDLPMELSKNQEAIR